MPRYDYRCEKCGYTWEQHFPIAERDTPLNEPCPECNEPGNIEKYLPSTSGLCYTVAKLKTPDSFKDLLKNIKSKHRHSSINV